MTIRVDNIRATDWSPQIGAAGEIVENNDDIDQCIRIILTTRKGSDPHRPLFGCDAWLWLDKPANVAIPNIIRESVDALEMWEPRIDLVRITRDVAASHVTIAVEWQPKDGGMARKTEVTYEPA